MAQARSGDTVRIHYTGRLDDGSVFDSSQGRDPLEFRLGSGQVIPGFDQAVDGMSPGEEKTITIPAAQAYGTRAETLVFQVGREQLPPGMQPEIGQLLEVSQGSQVGVVKIVEVTDDTVTLDANHPLAGENLTFDLKLVSIS